jgi:hypothetical protein
MEPKNDSNSDRSKQRDDLAAAIRAAFPICTVEKITPIDDELTGPPIEDSDGDPYDDSRFLIAALRGITWPQIPKEFLILNPDGYLLMSEEAFVAFLPAWLIQSLEEAQNENKVREFLAYSFNNGFHLTSNLNRQQWSVVHALLQHFAKHDPSSFIRTKAAEAISRMSRLN